MNLIDMYLQALFYERECRNTPTPDEEGVLVEQTEKQHENAIDGAV